MSSLAKAFIFIFLYILFLKSNQSLATFSEVDSPIPVSEQSFGSLLKEKLRIQNYSEWMTAALKGTSIPGPKGQALSPTLIDGRVWIDYAITPKYRIFYWQRYFVYPFHDYSFYDPRIGFRWMQVFDKPGLNTTYDFYFLPGISNNAQQAHRLVELGVRTNTTYSIPGSRWDIGIVIEINAPFYKPSVQGKNLWGVLAPWASYKISNLFSTQHWFMLPIKYQQGSFAWDVTGMPFVQNGIGWNASESIWVGTFLNNYLWATPSLKNTWVSIWLNVSFL